MNYPSFAASQPISNQAFLSLGQAVEEVFNSTDWTKFAYQVDEAHFISNHRRLLRSLEWRDPDYGECVLQTLHYLQNNRPSALLTLANHPKVQPWLLSKAPAVAVELGLGLPHVPPPPRGLTASEVVDRALRDADQLLHTSGPISCVDRIHTALHGYLREACSEASLNAAPDASITALFKLLRTSHSNFQSLDQQDKEIERVLGSLATTVDALNTFRNRFSVAHPNQTLLGEPEAMLMVNLTRSLFHYLEAKL